MANLYFVIICALSIPPLSKINFLAFFITGLRTSIPTSLRYQSRYFHVYSWRWLHQENLPFGSNPPVVSNCHLVVAISIVFGWKIPNWSLNGRVVNCSNWRLGYLKSTFKFKVVLWEEKSAKIRWKIPQRFIWFNFIPDILLCFVDNFLNLW